MSRLLTAATIATVVATAVAACGGDDRGRYVGRASNAAVFVTWTRSHDSLSGQLTQARIADSGDGTVDTQRVSFDGNVDGPSVSLRLDQGLGTSSTLTGELRDGKLTLDYPGRDGGIVAITLRGGDAEDFNRALAALRDRVSADKQAADEAAAEQQARDDAAALASSVRARMYALDRAVDNATASSPDVYRVDLATIRVDLDTAKASYKVLRDSVENDYGGVCDDAATVRDDIGTMRQDVAAMRADKRTNTDPGLLDQDIRAARSAFADMQALDRALLPADAPTKNELDAVISAARRKLATEGARGTKFNEAQALLAQGQALQSKADAACRRAGD